MQIKDIHHTDFLMQLTELLSKISIMFGLKEADTGFVAYFANTLKKYYGHLTFEQIELAFEYNSIGSLNEFLPKKGFSIDNKVEYTIPDMTKIIKAFCRLKKIDEDKNQKQVETNWALVNQMRQMYCDTLIEIFEKYQNTYERTPITLPYHVCDILCGVGLIEKSEIDQKEKHVNIEIRLGKDTVDYIGKKINNKINPRRSANEDLIYLTFDKIIGEGGHLRGLLGGYRNKFGGGLEMPGFD